MNEEVSAGQGMFRELRSRRVFRTAALYIVGARLVIQVVDVIVPGMKIPSQSIRCVLIAAVAGSPLAMSAGCPSMFRSKGQAGMSHSRRTVVTERATMGGASLAPLSTSA